MDDLQEIIKAPAQYLGKLVELEGYLLAYNSSKSSIYFAPHPYIKLPPRYALKIWKFSSNSAIPRALHAIPPVNYLHPDEFKFKDKARIKGFLVEAENEILFYPLAFVIERPLYSAYVEIEARDLEDYSSFELEEANPPYIARGQEVRVKGYFSGNSYLNLFYICDERFFELFRHQSNLSIQDETLQKLSLGIDAQNFQRALSATIGKAIGTEFLWLNKVSLVGELRESEEASYRAVLSNIKEFLIQERGVIFKLRLE